VSPRILLWDLENSPALGEFWGSTYNTNIIRVLQPSTVICFGAKWYGEKPMLFHADWIGGHLQMVMAARDLLDEADAVISYNGRKHDTPHINTEILQAGLTPPSPYREIDLYQVVKRRFKFQQNRLAYVSQQLQVGAKLQHEGHGLWVKVAAGDVQAQKKMQRYCERDVRLLEPFYETVMGWIPQSMHPNGNLYAAGEGCPFCGGTKVHRRGEERTSLTTYARFQCQQCGKWLRDKKALGSANLRGL
jgi:hypothetical protein